MTQERSRGKRKRKCAFNEKEADQVDPNLEEKSEEDTEFH